MALRVQARIEDGHGRRLSQCGEESNVAGGIGRIAVKGQDDAQTLVADEQRNGAAAGQVGRQDVGLGAARSGAHGLLPLDIDSLWQPIRLDRVNRAVLGLQQDDGGRCAVCGLA